MSETPELVRIAVEFFMPGSVIHSPRVAAWYKGWNHPHSRRILFPLLPVDELMHTHEDGSVTVRQDCMHIKLTAIGPVFIHPLVDGVIDNMMADRSLDELLGGDLSLIGQMALTYAPPYFNGRTTAAWIAVMKAVDDEQRISYVKRLHFGDLENI